MPAEFDKCVDALMKDGKSKDSAYAICVSQYIDKHGKSPFSKEEIGQLPVSNSAKQKLTILTEAHKQGKKVKLIEEITSIKG